MRLEQIGWQQADQATAIHKIFETIKRLTEPEAEGALVGEPNRPIGFPLPA